MEDIISKTYGQIICRIRRTESTHPLATSWPAGEMDLASK
jgi:hypothetical protein